MKEQLTRLSSALTIYISFLDIIRQGNLSIFKTKGKNTLFEIRLIKTTFRWVQVIFPDETYNFKVIDLNNGMTQN